MSDRERSRSSSSHRHKSRTRSRSRSPGPARRHTSRSPMSNRRRHTGSRDNPNPSSCLGVFGLSFYTTERELEKEFGKFGPIEKVQVVLDGKSGRSRGFAFINFEKIEDASEARAAMADTEIDGKKIRVDFSITKRPHTPTPGHYMGQRTSSSYRGDSYRDRSYRRSPSPRYYRRSPSPYYRSRRSPSPYYRSRRSPSPYYRRAYRSRSRSYSPRRYY